MDFMANAYTFIERTLPPRGGFFVEWFPNQEPGGKGPEEIPPNGITLKNHPQKLINFEGGSSRGVLLFRVLD